MVPEIGHFALILALMLAIIQSTAPLIGAYRRDPVLMALAPHLAVGQLFLIAVAFLMLMQAFITSDFSVQVVAENSHTDKPLLYKISGLWGNHEGSMLLWVLILAIFGGAVALFSESLPATLKARVLAVHGMIGLGFLLFILLTSNPFARLDPTPANGEGLNPILQDPGLAVHPPILYMGYVGFSMAFSFSVAALIEGRVDPAWARWVRPWVLAAWCFLTLGIALGSFWAYYTLGWGGWWFWDPVENASFMPWLAGTALLHSALVVERRHALQTWTILLGILTFSLSLIGTFLVRSGVVTSVHAFANDPRRGIFILALLVIATGGSLGLFAARVSSLRQGSQFAIVSREGGLVLNNIFLTVEAGVVFLGTFYPLLTDVLGLDKISVGAGYYNRTFVPIMIPLLLAMAVGPVLRWKRDDLFAALARLRPTAIATGVVAIAVLGVTLGRGLFTALGFALAAWLIVGSLATLAQRLKLGRAPFDATLQLAFSTPRAFYGLIIAHAGMGVIVAGITGMTSFQAENIRFMHVGDVAHLAGYAFALKDVSEGKGPNYDYERATFLVGTGDHPTHVMLPERHFYPVRQQTTTQAAISTNLLWNLYISFGEQNKPGEWAVRLYFHPFVPWIWLGAVCMALGGFLSLADRRLRLGMPQRQPARAILVAGE
jgi:cytochrome c-type biogenesis protein CcmF